MLLKTELKENTSAEPSHLSREELSEKVRLASESIAFNWPMRMFASRNPLMGYENISFYDAIRRAGDLTGGRGYLPNEQYRELLTKGRITLDDLKHSLASNVNANDLKHTIQVGPRIITKQEIMLLHLVHGFEVIDPELFLWKAKNTYGVSRFREDVPKHTQTLLTEKTAESHFVTSLWKHTLQILKCRDPFNEAMFDDSNNKLAASEIALSTTNQGNDKTITQEQGTASLVKTLGERVHHLTKINVVEHINDQMAKWCAAFLDEGLSDWKMPDREHGFYEAWRQCSQRDFSTKFIGANNRYTKIKEECPHPETFIIRTLTELGIPETHWQEYLTRHMAQLPGWAGFIRWRSEKPEYLPQAQYPITLVHYLAVRLFYEATLIQAICEQDLGCNGTLKALDIIEDQKHVEQTETRTDQNMTKICHDAWRFFHIIQFLGLSIEEFQWIVPEDACKIIQWLNEFPLEQHGPVWLCAHERHYRNQLLSRLKTRRSLSASSNERRPDAQATFCIDVRSEPFRRHLEAQGNYETAGYAGFFGAPIYYKSLEKEEVLPLCPVLFSPKKSVVEIPRKGQNIEHFVVGSMWNNLGHQLFHTLKSHPLTSYVLVDILGFLFGLMLLGKTIAQRPYRKISGWIHKHFLPYLSTVIPIETQTKHTQEETKKTPSIPYGFTLQEQAQMVENGLRLTGLTQNIARIVLFCGHGSTTDNNPYAAALDCGACGGSHGGPNARVLTQMANNSQVREEIQSRGIKIPDDTWFVAGQHDTTIDEVRLLDHNDIPETHQVDIDQLERALKMAGKHVAMERLKRLPNAPAVSDPDDATAHVMSRSCDWAQVRPEWGLSGNASMIIGKRSLTTELQLDGRTFLHNYHDDQDQTGESLEIIMTAPLVVAEWISYQYYFSTADPWVYGSGSKVLHNVVGKIGVMLGTQSDLQTGFPLQTVNDGKAPYHEPMRLLVIIQAPTKRISSIIDRHTVLQHYFNNQWLHLLALDSHTNTFHQYHPGGTWSQLLEDSEVKI